MNADTIQLKTPGLYLQGLEPEPYPPVVSGITGFVGVTEKGPLNQPRPIRNWGEFVDTFGGFISYGYLPRSVFGFFLNGGELCYIVGVSRSRDLSTRGGTGANDKDGFIYAQGILKDKDDNDCLELVAREKVKGSAGNRIRVQAAGFSTAIALKAPQTRADGKHFITVYCIEAFLGDEGQSFKISHELTSESITTAAGGVDSAANHLVLGNLMVNRYPVDAIISSETRFNLTVMTDDNPEPLEVFYNLSMDPTSARYFKSVINGNSDYIDVDHAAAGSTLPPVGEIRLAGGKDPGQIDYRYYTGYEDDGSYFAPGGLEPDQRLGLAALEELADVSLVAAPDLVRGEGGNFKSAQAHILFHCRKLGERFAVLDPLEEMTSEELLALDFAPRDATFGALYYPWLYCTGNGGKELVPPSGFITGIMARTDGQYGTHKAPANVKLKGIVDLETLIDRRLQDDLNEAGINCIRKFEDGMIKVWGARTLSKDKDTSNNDKETLNEDNKSKWRYVNIRRTFLYIIKILSKKLLWAVFEPNDRNLWKRIESSITAFLLTVVAKGMTAGTGPGDAFYVKCSEETNPGEVVAAGQVIAEVGIALTAPAEFIVITVKKTPESLNVIEEEI